MKHTIEELGERADDRGGLFTLLQHPKDDAPRAGRWEARMSDGDRREDQGNGDTPDAAVQDLLDCQEA